MPDFSCARPSVAAAALRHCRRHCRKWYVYPDPCERYLHAPAYLHASAYLHAPAYPHAPAYLHAPAYPSAHRPHTLARTGTRASPCIPECPSPRAVAKNYKSEHVRTSKRSTDLVNCRFRPQYVSCLARRSSETDRASSSMLVRFHLDNPCVA
eukprot:3318940-Pleurochrysis_carterae.AAC.2